MEKAKSLRNPIVELLRFVFAIMVVMVHSKELSLDPDYENFIFRSGYIAVEFFLILSGYFAAKAALKPLDETSAGKWSLSYTLKKYSSLMPTVVISVLLCFFVSVYKLQNWSDFPYAVFEMLLLTQTGLYKIIFNPPLWYLSAMLFTLPIFVYLIRKRYDFFINIGSILIPLFIYGYMCRTEGMVDTFLYFGQSELRVFAGLCMGLNAYRLSEFLGKRRFFEKRSNTNMYIITGFFILFTIFYSFFARHTYMDFLMIFMLTFSEAVIIPAKVNTSPSSFVYKLCIFLGKLSFSLYCTHSALYLLLPRLFPDKSYYQLLIIYVPAAILLALAVMALTALIKKLGARILSSVKASAEAN